MTFLNPGALWLLALALLVLVLYLLRRRPVPRLVPSTFLWRKALTEWEARTPFKRLRRNLLLFLQLLALTAIVLAAAGPRIERMGLSGKTAVVVVDTSASMAAQEGSVTRLDLGRRKVREALKTFPDVGRLALVEAGPRPLLALGLTADRPAFERALDHLQPRLGRAAAGEALAFAESLARIEPEPVLLIATDGSGWAPQLPQDATYTIPIQILPCGSTTPNMALTALDLAEGPRGYDLFARVNRFGQGSFQGGLQLRMAGKLLDEATINVEGGQSQAVLFHGLPPGQPYEVRLSPGDSFPWDDTAWIKIPAEVRPKVQATGDLDPYLAAALQSQDRVVLLDGAMPRENDGSLPPILIASWPPDGEAPDQPIWYLANQPPGSKHPSSDTEEKIHWHREHPLLRFSDLSGFAPPPPPPSALPEESEILAAIQGKPLIAAWKDPHGNRRLLWNFTPEASGLPQTLAFPLMVRNAVEWLAQDDSPLRRPFLKNDEPLPTDWEWRDSENQAVSKGGAFQPGLYRAETSSGEVSLAVNLLDAEESNLAPEPDIPLKGGLTAASAAPKGGRDIGPLFAILALITLTGEWILFFRR